MEAWQESPSDPTPTKTVKLTFVEVIRREFQIQLGSVMYSGVAFGQGFVKQIQLFFGSLKTALIAYHYLLGQKEEQWADINPHKHSKYRDS